MTRLNVLINHKPEKPVATGPVVVKGRRSGLLMSAASLAVGLASYGRGAYALNFGACSETALGVYVCSGQSSTTETFDEFGSIDVTTTGDFDLNTSSTGLMLRSYSGDISLSNEGRVVSTDAYGIYAQTYDGSVKITSSGEISSKAAGIRAVSGKYGSVEVYSSGTITSTQGNGINVISNGAVTVDVSGDVTSQTAMNSTGISVYSGIYSGPGLGYVERPEVNIGIASNVRGDKYGVRAIGNGNDVNITVSGDDAAVYGDKYGISVSNGDYGSNTVTVKSGGAVHGGIRLAGHTANNSVYVDRGATVTGDILDQTSGLGGGKYNTYVAIAGWVDGDIDLDDGSDVLMTTSTSTVTGDVIGGREYQDPQFEKYSSGDTLVFSSGDGSLTPQDTQVDLGAVDFDSSVDEGERFIEFENVVVRGNGITTLTGSNDDAGRLLALYGAVEIAGSAPNIVLQGAPHSRGVRVSGTGTIGEIRGDQVTISPGVSVNGAEVGEFVSAIGTLRVAGDVVLGGQVLDPIMTTLDVGEGLTPVSSTLHIQIAPDGSSDKLDIGGSIDLGGVGLLVDSTSTIDEFTVSRTYTIVEAEGGVTGQFSSIQDTLPDLKLVTGYSDNAVTLSYALDSTNLSEKDAAPAGSFGGAMSSLIFLDGIQNHALQGLINLRQPEVTSSVYSPLDPVVWNGDTAMAEAVRNTTIFGSALGERIDVDARGSAAGYDATLGGFFTGLQTHTNVNGGSLFLGAAVGLTNTDVDVTSGGSDVDARHFGVFGAYGDGNVTISGSLSYADLDLNTFRELGAVDGRGKTDGRSRSVGLRFARDVTEKFQTNLSKIEPFFAVKTVHTDFDGFTEAGSSLTVANTDVATHFLSAGVEFGREVVVGGIMMETSVSVGVEHSMGDRTATSVSNVGVGGDLVTQTAPIDTNRALLGLGLSFGEGSLKGNVGYRGSFGSDSSNNAATFGLAYTF